MDKKCFTFSIQYEFIADDEQDAIKQFQEMLDDNDWQDGLLNAESWPVEEEDVDVSEEVEHDDAENGCCECGSKDHGCHDCPTFLE
jgi:hypothetical protein